MGERSVRSFPEGFDLPISECPFYRELPPAPEEK